MAGSDESPASAVPSTLVQSSAAPAVVAELPEQFGRYRIVKRLGQGGMGSVYLADDTQLGRQVALKVAHLPGGNAENIERFRREARAAATLDHPNLCPVYDVGEVAGRHYLTMAYVEGRSLAELIRGGPPLPPRPVADLARKLALAMEEAHGKGVVHRDLKPSNIMINRRSEPVILDFGLARLRNADIRLTGEGALLGTPAYMPPEQVRGNVDAVGPLSDVYSLGVVLYEMLTGRLPFEGSLMAVLSQVLTSEPLRPTQHRPDLDPALEAICLKAMARNPADRYASMAEFAAALDGYLSGNAPVATITPAAPTLDTVPLASSISGPATQLIEQMMARLEASEARARRAARWPWLAAAVLLVGLGAVILILALKNDPPPATIVVYLNVTQLERAEPDFKFVLIGDQRIPREQLNEPIALRPGAHTLRLERADGKIVEFGEFTLTTEDNDKAVEVTPDRRVSVVEKKEPPPKPKQPEFVLGDQINLAAAVNGGWLADAPAQYDNNKWAARNLIDRPGRAQFATPSAGPISIVVGFKDGRPALVSRVGISPFAEEAKSSWVKRIQVEVSETYPFTGFKDAGTFDVHDSPDDCFFALPQPQRARFVRFTFLANDGGAWMEAGEVMVYGQLIEEDVPPAPLVNVAVAANGGKIASISSVYGSGWEALHLIDGNPGGSWAATNKNPQTAVIQLGRLAAVRHVAVNPYAKNNPASWVRDVEVLLSRTGKPGDFSSLGKLKLHPIGRDHVLSLETPVQARYVKILFLANGGGSWMEAHEIKVFADRTSVDEIELFNGTGLEGWKPHGGRSKWAVIGGVVLNAEKPDRFDAQSGSGVLLNGSDGKGADLVSLAQHGDCELNLEFNVPKGSNSGVCFHGHYEVQLSDSFGKANGDLNNTDCGAIYGMASPRVNACKAPGEWQTLQVVFQAPRFDASRRKTAHARFVRVVLNGTVVHENVEIVRKTTGSTPTVEESTGPVMLQGSLGIVAFRNVRLRQMTKE